MLLKKTSITCNGSLILKLLTVYKEKLFIAATRKQFLWYTVKEKISLNWRKFCWFKNIFYDPKVGDLITLKKIFFESTKLSSIQRNFFFDCISKKFFFRSKKYFFGSKKLFSQWIYFYFIMITVKYIKNLGKIDVQ